MGRTVLSILIAHRTVQALGMQVHMEAPGTHHSKRPKLDQNIHSFKNFYSASLSPLLLRGAPDSSRVKKNSCKTILKCVGKRPR